MNKETAIKVSKIYRQRLDEILQDMKKWKQELQAAPWQDQPAEGNGEVIAQHTLSIRDLESAIMRQGMTLKAIGNPTPYSESYNPESSKVHPTDGVKL